MSGKMKNRIVDRGCKSVDTAMVNLQWVPMKGNKVALLPGEWLLMSLPVLALYAVRLFKE